MEPVRDGLQMTEVPFAQATPEIMTKLASQTQQEIASIPPENIRGVLAIIVVSEPSVEGGLMTKLIGYNGTDDRVHVESMLHALNKAVEEIVKQQGATLNAQASLSNH